MPPFVVTQEWSRPKPVQNEPRPTGVIDLIYSQLLNEQPPACNLNCKRQWQYCLLYNLRAHGQEANSYAVFCLKKKNITFYLSAVQQDIFSVKDAVLSVNVYELNYDILYELTGVYTIVTTR